MLPWFEWNSVASASCAPSLTRASMLQSPPNDKTPKCMLIRIPGPLHRGQSLMSMLSNQSLSLMHELTNRSGSSVCDICARALARAVAREERDARKVEPCGASAGGHTAAFAGVERQRLRKWHERTRAGGGQGGLGEAEREGAEGAVVGAGTGAGQAAAAPAVHILLITVLRAVAAGGAGRAGPVSACVAASHAPARRGGRASALCRAPLARGPTVHALLVLVEHAVGASAFDAQEAPSSVHTLLARPAVVHDILTLVHIHACAPDHQPGPHGQVDLPRLRVQSHIPRSGCGRKRVLHRCQSVHVPYKHRPVIDILPRGSVHAHADCIAGDPLIVGIASAL
eukprot:815250-Rhodomonas_salina.2